MDGWKAMKLLGIWRWLFLLLGPVLMAGCAPVLVTPPVMTVAPTEVPAAEEAAPAASAEGMPGQQFVAPDGEWVAVLDGAAGSLDVVGADGTTHNVFPAGASAWAASWSPDSATLLVVLSNWEPTQGDVPVSAPPEIWRVALADGVVGEPQQVFRLGDTEMAALSGGGRVELVFGAWSPTSNAVVFWAGGGAAMRADGNAPFVLDVTTGDATRVAGWALVNPAYQSWAPDGTNLAMTVGGGRSAQANKWLNLVDLDVGTVSTIISKTAQIPGIVAWSPQGDRIAYAAVEAGPPGAYENDDHCCPITFDNPDIAGRRIYLLDPATGEHWRLNDEETFQDAPVWGGDGRLYYVERSGDQLALMAADPESGEAQVVAGSEQPLPDLVGYYGQSDWAEWLRDVPHVAE